LSPRSELERRFSAGDRELFGELLDRLAEAVTIRGTDGRLAYANRAALALLGFESIEALQARPTEQIIDDYVVQDEHGRPVEHRDLPSIQLLQGAEIEPLLLRTVHRDSGQQRWVTLTSTPLSRQGGLIGAMTEIRDLTAVKAAEVRTNVLAESGRLLASSLDYSGTLAMVAKVAVPLLADYCSVDLATDDGALERVAAIHAEPARRDLAEALATLKTAGLRDDHPVQRVLSTGRSLFLPDFEPQDRARLARDDHHQALLTELGIRSMVVVPLRVPRRSIGVMTLATDSSLRRLQDVDVELAEQLGRRAAVAVENSRMHTKLADVAETLQRALLPSEPPDLPGWQVAAMYRPIETELRIDVGGDFYEFFAHDASQCVILGDVAGKGVTVASVTALLRHGARVAASADPSPAMILERLSEALFDQPGNPMATALCMCLLEDRIVVSSAGHPPAVIVASDGHIRQVPETDVMLGAFPGSEWHEEEVPIAQDELLVLYTDGVTDARSTGGERFGGDRLRQELASLGGLHPSSAIARLEAALLGFTGGRYTDDLAVLAFSRSQAAG
jgi:PAS domain S-box-containing protein